MTGRWFRFYDDALNEPKVLRLTDAQHRGWVGLLCVASKHGGTLPSVDDIAILLRTKPEKVAALIAGLVKAGLLDKTETGYEPHNWSRRQFKSDVSTERVKRYREQQRNVSGDVSETPPETEQNTEQNRAEGERRARAPEVSPSDEEIALGAEHGIPAARVPAEIANCRAWHTASGKLIRDWPSSWRLWCLRHAQSFAAKAPPAAAPAPTATTIIEPGTPQWDAWKAHLTDTNATFRIRSMNAAAQDGTPYTVPSPWPPGHQAADPGPISSVAARVVEQARSADDGVEIPEYLRRARG